jgi:succinate dehydrogenase / fumarate reductase iron-sulfur subunit
MDAVLRIFRGNHESSGFQEYAVPLHEGMVVLDAIHHVQAHQASDLACRWNCKAGRCGSCGAEVNGKPKLMCMTRMDQFPAGEPITVAPMRTFPVIKDLVCDVSWNFAINQRMQPFHPRSPDDADGSWRMQQVDIDRIQEFRKCIECFLCQDVCHVLREHDKTDSFVGPRYLVRAAGLEMHPIDDASRTAFLKQDGGIGLCNITKCCTEVCPESIHITDNAIIPLKERVVDEFYDPLRRLWRRFVGRPQPP